MNRLGTRSRIVVGVLLVVLVGVLAYVLGGPHTAEDASGSASTSSSTTAVTGSAPVTSSAGPVSRTAAQVTAGPRGVVPAAITEAAWATLAEIDAGRWPGSANAPGTRGGDTWQNREGTLPRTDPAGVKVAYREWDVNPKKRGETRDAERIVTGSNGSAWYTADHYTSFARMR
ncbi:ribonuclease domain-containing protein [Rhodococcus sp. NPDC127528]|uniref:ribonuclease domain-containing protein n=1 Tax=unclassified Rhodococcus (in: high G+C Gram-positive bacteria) TaxID=192944 RepID=UPI00363CF20F